MVDLTHELLNGTAKIAGILGQINQTIKQSGEDIKDYLVQIEVEIKGMNQANRACQLKVEDIKNDLLKEG